MTTTSRTTEPPDEGGGEVARGLAALELHLAQAAAGDAPDDRGVPEPAPDEPRDVPEPAAEEAGVTRRVRARLAEHAEAHHLLRLQDDDAPFQVASNRVRRRRKAVAEAGELWQLARDPRVLAWRDARVRRLLVTIGLVALTLALAWSTAGVQLFAAEDAAKFSPQWWFAWVAEPFCSLALLMVVGGRAYLTTRGRQVDAPGINRTEWTFLGLTLGMNAWPHLPGVAEVFTVSSLVLHLLGPVVAVAIVRALPPLLAAFTTLGLTPDTTPAPAPAPVAAVTGADRPEAPAPEPATAPAAAARPALPRRATPVRTTAGSTIPEPKRRTREQLQAEFERAVRDRPAGFDPANAESIRRTLKCGKPIAAELRDGYLTDRRGEPGTD
ncbi:conjugal transfer protein TraI [Amycolatopsis panacis]|uniref:Conjugal transfer protein TraI n=1 Tax=Amycolatopsis panacis TaxID=2340917 RepID=A0A419I3K5_9PSEU|nr:conjugal transfer protein TraI [Amycolatopsis panacis]RJQ84755.1 conjugal transfer protein TraI [Amycolatopsis panacis]